MERNIGKNTIGDNNKMSVDLKTYNMSTHDLSTVVRNTQAPGTLVPNLTLLVQKGDIIDIDIEANVLTHPTVGPLFGSFKLEHHVYTVPFRLYNSWLHNNRTKIGLDMSQVKIPQLNVGLKNTDNPKPEDEWTQVNPSCLLAYLGIRGYGSLIGVTTKNVEKNAVPLIGYYDIFKNYYANTQEDKFYTIGGARKFTITINDTGYNTTKINKQITNGDKIAFTPTPTDEEKANFTFIGSQNLRYRRWKGKDIGIWAGNQLVIQGLEATSKYELDAIYNGLSVGLQQWELESLDTLRDNILTTKGNVTFSVTGIDSVPILQQFNERSGEKQTGYLKTTAPQFGLALKTYNSDLYQNWINTDWIEGVNGINEISSVDVSDGSLSMDALNLAQKVYNMLNRIAVSGGTYRDWLETVFTGGEYMERCETPVFEGGTSQEIVFQEVISNSATEQEPLGALAGRGVTTNKQRGGHIKIKVTEPGYIMCICSITPRIDYSQGNQWDTELKTMDDLHKPALDGIGYQDSINSERAWWAGYYNADPDKKETAAGKTVAWINYMTNVNRTYGNFAIKDNEAFMVMNRNYELEIIGGSSPTKITIGDLSTYIDPVKFNYIFADTNLEAMNFWIQTKFDIKARRLISAKQIPNL
nr:MAG TPA: Major capsid protein [Microviridae sp.]